MVRRHWDNRLEVTMFTGRREYVADFEGRCDTGMGRLWFWVNGVLGKYRNGTVRTKRLAGLRGDAERAGYSEERMGIVGYCFVRDGLRFCSGA